METQSTIKMPGTPPKWVNRVVSAMLHVPGVRHLFGNAFALITVTGAVSGKSYTTPVQYVTLGDRIVVLSQRHRRWWRNIATNPDVTLLVRGRDIGARAKIADDDIAAVLTDCLTEQPRVAKFYGIPIEGGVPTPSGIAELATRVVAIVIEPRLGADG